MSVKFTILGCGSSLGIPRIDGYFGRCDPKNKKNFRSRCSALITIEGKNLLIDTSPDLKNQLLLNKVKNIDKVFFTHHHADQTHGINELRVFYLKRGKKIPIYADKNTQKVLLNSFKYCFKSNLNNYPPILKMHDLKKIQHFSYNNKKLSIRSITVRHGNINSNGFIINSKCAYIPDVNEIYKKDFRLIKNLKYLVIDCLRYNFHPSHYTYNDILKLTKLINPKKTFLTNLNNEIDFLSIKKILPKNISPAYDGMSLNL